MRRRISIISAILTAFMLSTSVFAAVDVNIAFENKYFIAGENKYNVFGENNTDSDQKLSLIAVTYKGGAATSIEVGEPVTVASGAKFDISGAFNLPEGSDFARIFAWEDTKTVSPLTEPYTAEGVSFEYTLEKGAKTSAGVYDEDDNLVRTLWSAEDKGAGVHRGFWDGKDDYGTEMKDGKYYIIVMSHNVNHEMYTLVGNTSERVTKYNMMSEYRQISDMSVFGNRMYYSQQYMENSRTWNYFNLDNCHNQAGWFEKNKKNKITIRNCTDGKYVYWLSSEHTPQNYIDPDAKDYVTTQFGNPRVFIAALDPVANQEVIFEGGRKINNFWGAAIGHQSAICIKYTTANDVRETFGDIAVQKNSNALVAIYGYGRAVRVIDKNSGYLLKDNYIDANGETTAEGNAVIPIALCFDKDDNIWISYKDDDDNAMLSKFKINEDGNLIKLADAPKRVCLDDIIALAVSPSGGDLIMAYGGDMAKFASYDISDWSQNYIVGRDETYEESPKVYDDKFMFLTSGGHGASGSDLIDYTFLTFENENTLWLGDSGNDRCLKYDLSTGVPVISDRIHQSVVSYNVAADSNNPSTIIHGTKEYNLVYDTENPDAAWTLERNWARQTAILEQSTMSFIDGLTTLENGKTYFAATTYRNGKYNIYEKQDTALRCTKVNIRGYQILNDGKMTLQKAEDMTYEGVSGTGFYQRYLKGIDSDGDPYWGEDVLLAFVPKSDSSIKFTSKAALSERGILFDVNEANSHADGDLRDFKMGAVLAQVTKDNDFIIKAAPATGSNYNGDFPDDGYLEVNAWYTWHDPYAYGRNIVAQYRGEGYRQYQANKFYHFYDNGLLVDMFGEATGQMTDNVDDYCGELVNGNGFCWVWVKSPSNPEDEAYTIQGGEAGMSGALVYKITGLSTIREEKIPITLNCGSRNGLTAAVYGEGGTSFSERLSKKIVNSSSYSKFFDEGEKNVWLTGYLEMPENKESIRLTIEADGNAALYVDDKLEAEGTGTLNKIITSKKGRKSKIKLVLTPNQNGYAGVKLFYTNDEGEKVLLPKGCLKTEAKVYEGKETVRNLLEGLPYNDDIGEGKFYGWDFSNWSDSEGRTMSAKTNVRNYHSDGDNDLMLSANIGKNNNCTDYVWVERSLGDIREDMNSWEISAKVMFDGILNGYFDGTGGQIDGERGRYIDILDINDKIVARVYPGDDYAFYGNGEKILQMSVPKGYTGVSRNYIHPLSDQSDLKIYATDGKINIAYREGSIQTEVYQEGALWNKPAKIRISAFENCFYSPHGDNYNTDFSLLKFTQYAKEEMCTVTFFDEDRETVLSTVRVQRGTGAAAPNAEKDGYILSWSDSFACVTEDMEIYAIYTPVNLKHDVVFMDHNGMHLATLSGVYGEEVSYTPPEREGYTFIGWYTDPVGGEKADLVNRLDDITVYARYEKFATALYDFEDIDEELTKALGSSAISGSTGQIKSGDYTGVQGKSGFLNVEYHLTENGNLYKQTVNGSTAVEVRAVAKGKGDYIRFDFKEVDGDKKFKVYFDTSIRRFYDTDAKTDNNGGFGTVYGKNEKGEVVDVVKMTATSKDDRGIAVWDKDKSSWITLSSETSTWMRVEYRLNLKAQTADIYLDGKLITTVPFVNPVSSVFRLEFNMLNGSTEGSCSRYYLDNVGVGAY